MMPSMDGLTCIRTLQAINPQVKTLVVSGLASRGAVTKAMSLGIQAFLPKPFTCEELASILSVVINSSQ